MIVKLTEYIFIVPLVFSAILILRYLIEKKNIFKFKSIEEIQGESKGKDKIQQITYHWRKIFKSIGKYASPPKNGRIYSFYLQLLRYTKFNVESYFALKVVVVFMSLLLLLSIRYTNISVYTEEIFSRYEYKLDLIYQQDDRLVDIHKALEQEIYVMKIAIDSIPSKELMDNNLKGETMKKIRGIIIESNLELELPSYTVANKVYYRLKDYYSVRDSNYNLYAYLIIAIYLISDGIVLVYNLFAKANAKIELRFLKKLIILNGNFQDVGFTELLTILISKSKYYKRHLKAIEEVNNKNTIENESVYREIMSNIKDENAKLFFEKLEQANNSNFEHAIRNIQEEEKLEEEERKIKVNARVEVIHSFGVVGAFIIIYLLINYLLTPWLKAHDISSFY